MTPLTHISVTSIQDFQKCPLRWCYRWLDNRVARREPVALTVGKAVHTAFERHFEGGASVGQELEIFLRLYDGQLLTEYEEKAQKELQGLVEPLLHWSDFYPVTETLEVEEPFEYKLHNGLIFQGRPDRVVLVNDHVFHMQHKTISASRNLDTYIQVARRSMHELLYGDHLAQKYAEKGIYGGTIYNIVRKLKHKSAAKGKNFGKVLHEPHEFFLQTPIPVNPVLVYEAKRDLGIVADEMTDVALDYAKGLRPPSSRHLDEDMFSKRTDTYFWVLMGEQSLDDDSIFQDREILYPTTTEDPIEQV